MWVRKSDSNSLTKTKNFLTSCKPVSFSRSTLHRGVSECVCIFDTRDSFYHYWIVCWPVVTAILSLGAVTHVWYCLSGFSMLPIILQIDVQNWLDSILCISNWVSCMGPHCVIICDQTEALKYWIFWLYKVYITLELKRSYFIKCRNNLLVPSWEDVRRV